MANKVYKPQPSVDDVTSDDSALKYFWNEVLKSVEEQLVKRICLAPFPNKGLALMHVPLATVQVCTGFG